MSEQGRPSLRVLVAAVTSARNRVLDDLAKCVADEVRAARFTLVRSVMVKGEAEFIQQLVSNVANDNEADALVLVGGAGIGPRDSTCEALDTFFERRIEGFGDAYRRMLSEQFEAATKALLARATAGVYNQCVVFALTGPPSHVRRAVQVLVVPTLPDAVELATGRARAFDTKG